MAHGGLWVGHLVYAPADKEYRLFGSERPERRHGYAESDSRVEDSETDATLRVPEETDIPGSAKKPFHRRAKQQVEGDDVLPSKSETGPGRPIKSVSSSSS
jgi:hypothetical protein